MDEKSGQAYPQPGQAPQSYPQEPPPQYEPPKEGQGYQQGYPQQSAYPQQPGYQATTVITQPTCVVMPQTRFGSHSMPMQCPNCQAQITTSVNYETGTLTWVAAGVICLVGCWLGCCLIPFCVNDLQDCIHTCPNCNQRVGVYRRMS